MSELAHTTDDVHGKAVITADQANTITFHDISTATLVQHVSDFFFERLSPKRFKVTFDQLALI
jgi:hypothetical protein